MSFELVFHYYDRSEEGKYITDDPKQFTKKLGKSTEEVPFNKLANLILTQLSRRDLLIFNVEIFEYAKKQISFKETKDGILIKNKKYTFDASQGIVEEEIPEKVEIENKQNFKLTAKKKYPIFEEVDVPRATSNGASGLDYVIEDDLGRRIRVPSIHFYPEIIGLPEPEAENIHIRSQQSVVDMPILRR